MALIAVSWIATLLLIGGFALDRVISSALTRNFDAQLEYALTAMIASAGMVACNWVALSSAPVVARSRVRWEIRASPALPRWVHHSRSQ